MIVLRNQARRAGVIIPASFLTFVKDLTIHGKLSRYQGGRYIPKPELLKFCRLRAKSNTGYVIPIQYDTHYGKTALYLDGGPDQRNFVIEQWSEDITYGRFWNRNVHAFEEAHYYGSNSIAGPHARLWTPPQADIGIAKEVGLKIDRYQSDPIFRCMTFEQWMMCQYFCGKIKSTANRDYNGEPIFRVEEALLIQNLMGIEDAYLSGLLWNPKLRPKTKQKLDKRIEQLRACQ